MGNNIRIRFAMIFIFSWKAASLSWASAPFSDLPEDEPVAAAPQKSTSKNKAKKQSSKTTAKNSSKKKTSSKAQAEKDDLDTEFESEMGTQAKSDASDKVLVEEEKKALKNDNKNADDLEKQLDEDVVAQSPADISKSKSKETDSSDSMSALPDEDASTAKNDTSPDDLDKDFEKLSKDDSKFNQTNSGMTVTEEPLPESDKDPTLSPGISEKDFQSADASDIKEVEKKFDKEVMPHALVDSAEDPGAALPPDEKFFRVPLRPRMSDASWRKWAGPALTKLYKIRKNDSLWAVSERLFGTPYLWPKVWHLNAEFGNPNVIEPGVEIQFNPGNPNSAPNLALLKNGGESKEPMPLLIQNRPLSIYERLEASLLMQVNGKNPPFTHFLIYQRPKAAGAVPDPESGGKLLWTEGDTFRTRAPDGNYALVRVKFYDEESIYGQRIQWVGNVQVEGRDAKITSAYTEIQEGDLLLDRDFRMAPTAVHEDSLESLSRKVKMVQLQDGVKSFIGENNLVGIVFPSSQTGPSEGALLNIEKNRKKVGTVLIINRDQRMATAWVVDSTEEFDYESTIQ